MKRWLAGLILIMITGLAWADAARVLVVHSYSQEYPWTSRQHLGFLSSLNYGMETSISYSVEYLDTKRLEATPLYFQSLTRHMQLKYRDLQPDLIYVTDDDAFRFATRHLAQLFPGVPLVFSGVNDADALDKLHDRAITGVFEKKSIVNSIEWLRQSGIALDNVTFIGDGSSTYQAMRDEILRDLPDTSLQRPLFIESNNLPEMLGMLSSLNSRFVYLTTIGAMRDSEDKQIPLPDIISAITRAGSYAVLTLEDSYMYPGVLGGLVNSGWRQGETAGLLALAVLQGQPIATIQPVLESPGQYMFDYRELQKHNIQLPGEIFRQAEILNKPPSFIEANRRTILLVMFLLAGAVIVLLVVGVWLLQRKNAEIFGNVSKLRTQRQEMENIKGSLVEAQHIAKMGNWDWNLQDNSLYWSDGIYKLFGISPSEFEASYDSFLLRVHPDDRELVEGSIHESLRNKEPYLVEHRVVHPDGTTLIVQETGEVIYDEASGKAIRMIGTVRDVTAEREAERKLLELATYDTLTKLPNRNTLFDRVGQAIRRAHRSGHKLALLFLDLDRFKHINDSLGHAIGDKLLIEAANRLRALVREEDTVARLGGDEFVVLLESLDNPRDAAMVAEKIIDCFHQEFNIDDYDLHVTTSVGITLYPDDGEDEITLLKNADAAMYHAKDSGRNAYSFYTEEITRQVDERVELEHRLRDGLLHDRFEAHYQPIVNLATGQIVGLEALLRWHDDHLGQVSPSRFIPVAEESGIIFSLGAWMFRNVCEQIADWLARSVIDPDLQVNINISGIQLMQGGFVDDLIRILDETDVPASMLMIELTETVFFENRDLAASILARLVKRGMRVAVDDFGTGYSSLSYLKEMPVDTIKIDRSFVRDIALDENDRAITRAVILLGKSLGLKVVAEGVETQEQRSFLLKEGCVLAQGFYYYRPLPLHELESVLQRGASHSSG